MGILDEEGRLFGVVNVVDALAVVLTLAVIVAGVALVNPFAGDPATRYVTVDLGPQPTYRSEQIASGDRLSVARGSGDVTVTDVYVGPNNESHNRVILRVRADGELVESDVEGLETFQVGGQRIIPGRELEFDGGRYTTAGVVTRVEPSGSELNTAESRVLVETKLSDSIATVIQPGDTYDIDGREVARVTDVKIGPAGAPDERHALMAITLHTLDRSGTPYFGDDPVTVGDRIRLKTGAYNVTANVVEKRTREIRTRDVPVILEAELPTSTATAIVPGDSYRIGNRSIATVNSVRSYPTSDEQRKLVQVGVTLEATERAGEAYFGNRSIQLGSNLTLRTASYRLKGTITGRGTADIAPSGSTSVTLKLANVPPEVAENVAIGMTERGGGQVLAEVTDKRVEGARVVLTSDDGNVYERIHPRNKDVYLTVDLETRQTGGTTEFHARQLRLNRPITLDLGALEITGRVIEINR